MIRTTFVSRRRGTFGCSRALEASTPDIVEACRWRETVTQQRAQIAPTFRGWYLPPGAVVVTDTLSEQEPSLPLEPPVVIAPLPPVELPPVEVAPVALPPPTELPPPVAPAEPPRGAMSALPPSSVCSSPSNGGFVPVPASGPVEPMPKLTGPRLGQNCASGS